MSPGSLSCQEGVEIFLPSCTSAWVLREFIAYSGADQHSWLSGSQFARLGLDIEDLPGKPDWYNPAVGFPKGPALRTLTSFWGLT